MGRELTSGGLSPPENSIRPGIWTVHLLGSSIRLENRNVGAGPDREHSQKAVAMRNALRYYSILDMALRDQQRQDVRSRRRIVTKQELVREQRSRILGLARQHGVKSVRVFGSVATGRETQDSDVDFLVEVEPGRSLFDLGGLQVDLEELLRCKVDVVTPKGLRARLRSRVLEEAVAV